MRIVIEGPDGVGKSTLAHYLATILRLEYLHRGPPSSREELIHDIHLDDVIFDRSWLGNVVYSGLLIENTQYMTIPEMEAEAINANIHTLYILLTSPLPTYFNEQPEHLTKIHSTVHTRFINVFNSIKSGEKVIFNAMHFGNVDDMLSTVADFVYKWTKHIAVYPPVVHDYRYTLFDPDYMSIDAPPVHSTACSCEHFEDHKLYNYWRNYGYITEGAGNHAAEWVFLGEAPGYNGCGWLGIPFYGDKSGAILRNALFWNRIAETEVFITNAVKCTPKNNGLVMWKGLRCFLENTMPELAGLKGKIVAVGTTAAVYLSATKYGDVDVHIVHPAYLLYKHQDSMAYVDIMHKALYGELKWN